MAESYDHLAGTEMDVKDHPDRNIPDDWRDLKFESTPLPQEKPMYRNSTTMEDIGDILTGNRSGPTSNLRKNDYGQKYQTRK